MYDIVLKNNEKYVLASCPTLEIAEKYLQEMLEIDKELQKYYKWSELPEYKIIKKRYKKMREELFYNMISYIYEVWEINKTDEEIKNDFMTILGFTEEEYEKYIKKEV